jgi:hypothetical protein
MHSSRFHLCYPGAVWPNLAFSRSYTGCSTTTSSRAAPLIAASASCSLGCAHQGVPQALLSTCHRV